MQPNVSQIRIAYNLFRCTLPTLKECKKDLNRILNSYGG